LELSANEGGPKPLWFSINSEKGETQSGDAVFASSIKTNLKRLNSAEINVLTRHAGALLMHRLENYTPELLNSD
ncbi:MAG: patatin-like phospholipase family protein, partial [Sedimenticola sp.]|nr:patatin-like phospholipase family protein [Sedimenticola sp.]